MSLLVAACTPALRQSPPEVDVTLAFCRNRAIASARMGRLPLMRRLDSSHASTSSLGQVMTAALDDGAKSLLIEPGGSAPTNGAAPGRVRGAAPLLRRAFESPTGLHCLTPWHATNGWGVPPPGGVELFTDTTVAFTAI